MPCFSSLVANQLWRLSLCEAVVDPSPDFLPLDLTRLGYLRCLRSCLATIKTKALRIGSKWAGLLDLADVLGVLYVNRPVKILLDV